jgi:trehalose synthase
MKLKPYTKTVEDYKLIVDPKEIDKIYKYASKLQNEHIVMVSSTPAGGGVAEILNSLVLLLNSLGVKTGWRILKGPDNFFQITKDFHNALQGAPITLNKRTLGIYQQVNYNNAMMNHLGDHDLVVVHDPQPLPLIQYYKKCIPWIWRFHLDLSKPNKELLNYLKPIIEQYDAMIVSTPEYKQKSVGTQQIVFAPSIDPLSDKNKELDQNMIELLLRRQRVRFNKPIISQISRFDKWKDPLGVVQVFEQVRKKIDCQLVLMGNMAIDDPEGPKIYREVIKHVNNNPDVTVLLNCADNDRTVNALQRASKVVIQKSIKEGFALTVSEALWKGTPVVGTEVGGIPLQVIDKKTGYLVKDKKQAANACLRLLKNQKLQETLGRQGKEHVRKNFLITRHVLDYLKLFDFYLNVQHKFNIGVKYPY